MEIWKSVLDYEGFYEVSDLGRVRSVARSVSRGLGRSGVQRRISVLLTPSVSAKGYLRLQLCKNGICKKYHVHVLVLEAFVSPRPLDLEGCHRNGNQLNNEVGNLKWATSEENNADRATHRTLPRGSNSVSAKIDEVIALKIKSWIASGFSTPRIVAELGVSKHIVNNIRCKKAWAHV